MSNSVWLALALGGTFMTIVIIGIAVDMVLGERRRPVTLLRAHVGQVSEPVPNLREEQLGKSALQRLLFPTAAKVGAAIGRFTPFDLYRRTNRLLVLAGSPAGWDAERVVSLKIILGIVGLVGGLAIGSFLPLSGAMSIVVVALFTLIGYTVPSAQLSSMASRRQKEMRRSLSDTMDLLTISVEAGLGFDAALAQVMRNVPGPLAEEIGRLLQEMQIGASRAEAFRHMSERTDVPELNGFILSMIQADLFGVSIANVLRAQSKELRQKRRQYAEELAQKVPVKLLFPMIFMILPALFVVILGPGAIKIYQQFFGH